jgi:hypothetical protein
MTPQFNILTGLAGYYDEEKGLCMNPFYRATLEYVKKHIDKAQALYPRLFLHFVEFWHISRLEVPAPPVEWATLVIE